MSDRLLVSTRKGLFVLDRGPGGWRIGRTAFVGENVTLAHADTNTTLLTIPSDAAGKNFHVICEVTDDGTPSLTGYRRIVFQPPAR